MDKVEGQDCDGGKCNVLFVTGIYNFKQKLETFSICPTLYANWIYMNYLSPYPIQLTQVYTLKISFLKHTIS